MNNSLGKIIDVEGNIVTISIDSNVLNCGNLMNIHVVFDDRKKKLVGEIQLVEILIQLKVERALTER